ncbi:twin-arginine translocase subunit TatB [Ciceribacter sp. L1K23]|uniref:Sec-independent protein translocase protein TatB n=1 Tax=Ciceribacter sp. L1K23 TaxID=2820276 RepID=UPI001B829CFF|nr:Sec-independent protein translocase protein TatB [Ciceribacter sp. L1K23]MBR0555808.1 twin-arginine translocase subunit TatB [Ciceribacter sp. L1K23]
MLDIGWSELLVVAVILIVVVGPKDLPPMLRAFGKMMTKLRRTAGEFRSQFDEALREADLEDVGRSISDVRKFNPASVVRDAISPLREVGDSIRSDIGKATTAAAGTAAATSEAKSAPLPEMPSPLPPVTSDLVKQADPAPAAPAGEQAKAKPAKSGKTAKTPAAKPATKQAKATAPAAVVSTDNAKAPARKPKAAKPAEPKPAEIAKAAPARKAPARRKTATTTKDKA